MSRNRSLLGGLIAAAALIGIPSAAAAATVTPYGSFTGTAAPATFTFAPNLKLICTSSTIGGTVNPVGSGQPSITGASPTFGGCNAPALLGSSGLGPLTITAKEPMAFTLSSSAPGVLTTTLGKISLHVNFTTFSCSFDLTGTEVVQNDGSSPLRVSKLSVTGAAPSSLLVSNVSAGGCSVLFHKGEKPQMAGEYALSPELIVSF
jgi:hypothetical protein